MSLAMDCGTSSYRSNCMVNVARPCDMERRSVAYPNISDSGTLALIDCDVADRLERLDPAAAAVQVAHHVAEVVVRGDTSTAMTGSSSFGFERLSASLKAIEPAILNARSLESTSW